MEGGRSGAPDGLPYTERGTAKKGEAPHIAGRGGDDIFALPRLEANTR